MRMVQYFDHERDFPITMANFTPPVKTSQTFVVRETTRHHHHKLE